MSSEFSRTAKQVRPKPTIPSIETEIPSTMQVVPATHSPFGGIGKPFIDIPARYYYGWLKTQGEWTWHPEQGPCGPEGQGPGDDNFIIPDAPAGSLNLTWNGDTYLVYEKQYDLSQGGGLILNDLNVPLRVWSGCNDHEDGYDDNSGAITHWIALVPEDELDDLTTRPPRN